MASKYEMVPQPVYENGIWKGAKVDLPEGYHKLGQRIFDQFKQNPDFVGQIDGLTGEEDTYKSMGDRSIRCALWLIKQGIRQGDIVGLCSKNQLDSCIPLFSSLYLGCICSILSHKYVDEELAKYYLETRTPKALFIDEDNVDVVVDTTKKMGLSLPIIVFGQRNGLLSFREILKVHKDEKIEKFRCREVKPQDPAIINDSSGTTNLPKAVLHSFGSYANMLTFFQNDGEPSTVLGFYGLNGIAGVRLVIRSVIFKATMIVINNLSGAETLEIIDKYKVTQLWMSIYTSQRFMKTPDLLKYDLSSVKLVTCGGGRGDRDTIEFLQKLFYNAELHPRYGGTEFGPATTKYLDGGIKLSSAGRVMANVEIKIVDTKTKQILGTNEEGEIYIRTPKMMTCYWDNQKATIEAIDSEGWYHTEDLGYYDADGNFFFVGRYNEYIFFYNDRILSSVIVDVIKQVPGVNEVAVVSQPHPDHYEVPMAFITTIPGANITEDDVHKAVEKKLPDYMKLRGGIHFLQSMPTTDTDKINLRILRQIAKTLVK